MDKYQNLLQQAEKRLSGGQEETAIGLFKQAVDVNPRGEEGYGNLALMYFKKRDFDMAKNYFEKIISISPRNPFALNNLGVLYY